MLIQVESNQTKFTKESLDELLRTINLDSPKCEIFLYGLVDAAQIINFNPQKISGVSSTQFISLIEEQIGEKNVCGGPFLVTRTHARDVRSIEWLVEKLNQSSCVSFLFSKQNSVELANHLGWLSDVIHDDGTEWVMRFYDPRILPFWLDILSEEQRNMALANIHTWIYKDVCGDWKKIHGNECSVFSQPSEPMQITSYQQEALMQHCLPYSIIAMLNDDDVSILAATPEVKRYDITRKAIEKATQEKLESMIDIKTFCTLFFRFGEKFSTCAIVRHALQSPLAQSAFSQRVAAWTPKEWQQLQEQSSDL